MTVEAPPRSPRQESQDLDALIKEARQRARRRKMLYALAAFLVAGGIAAGLGAYLSGGRGHASAGSGIPVTWSKASSKIKGTLTGVVSETRPTKILLFAAQPSSHTFRLLDNGPFDHGPWVDDNPVASPDGRMIAFARTPNLPHKMGDGSLFVLDRASGRVTRLAKTGGGGDVQWTPDGQRIVYVPCLPTQGCEISSIRQDGSGRRVLATNVRTSAAKTAGVSPDSRWVAFAQDLPLRGAARTAPTGLYIERLDGSRRRMLLERTAILSVSWSTRGWITFGTRRSIEAVTPSGRYRTYCTNGCNVETPTWSPDGSRLAFQQRNVSIVRANGKDLHRLTAPVAFGAWSPDGRRIALLATLGGKGWASLIFVARPTGGTPQLLARIPGHYVRVSGWLRK
jgi:dipeptidyl aminopeptidase/acylaminoacyl peptidase